MSERYPYMIFYGVLLIVAAAAIYNLAKMSDKFAYGFFSEKNRYNDGLEGKDAARQSEINQKVRDKLRQETISDMDRLKQGMLGEEGGI